MTDDTTGKQRKTLLTSARLYADDGRSRIKNPDQWKIELERKDRIRKLEKQNSELWIAARAKGWNIFNPDWNFIGEIPAHQLHTLCGLSVGLTPYFCNESWLFLEAKFHLNGDKPDLIFDNGLLDAHVGTYQASKIDEFIRRLKIACANLEPLGTLPIASGEANAQFTLVNKGDFINWALSKNWDLPEELKLTYEEATTFVKTKNRLKTNNKQQPKTNIEFQNKADERLNSMLKLIFVMAVDGYQYDPKNTRNSATGDKFGINEKIEPHINKRFDNATIKSCLDKAEALLGLSNNETRDTRAKTISLLFIGMAMDCYTHSLNKQIGTPKKLLEAITLVNDKLSLNIDIDSDVIEEILTEAKQALPTKPQKRRET